MAGIFDGATEIIEIYDGATAIIKVYDGATLIKDLSPPALVEESSTPLDVDTTAIDPWDITVPIPAGSNRVLLDFVAYQSLVTYEVRLDPAGDNILVAEDANSPAAFTTGSENVLLHTLLEASFPGTTGNKTLRWNPSAARIGRRRVVVLSGASQTIFTAANSHDANAAFTITLNRPSGTFPIGSKVYAAMFHESGSGAFTVTGDVTEVDDETVASGTGTLQDQWVFAAGTLASAVASVSATFTPTNAGIRRAQAIIVVVEPA